VETLAQATEMTSANHNVSRAGIEIVGRMKSDAPTRIRDIWRSSLSRARSP